MDREEAAKMKALKAEAADLRDALRLIIGRSRDIPWHEIKQSEVDSYLTTIRKLKAKDSGRSVSKADAAEQEVAKLRRDVKQQCEGRHKLKDECRRLRTLNETLADALRAVSTGGPYGNHGGAMFVARAALAELTKEQQT